MQLNCLPSIFWRKPKVVGQVLLFRERLLQRLGVMADQIDCRKGVNKCELLEGLVRDWSKIADGWTGSATEVDWVSRSNWDQANSA